ncbi:scoloptoxin SSD976 isoform X2 [Aethina tumida]|nr:scoloptoxin SSD976 isoform X2 [Aethina tumida]
MSSITALAIASILVTFGITAYGYGCTGRTMLSGVSDYEKQVILDMHNKMRQLVANGQVGGQPPAANMMEMKWDNELAARAQRWVDQCNEDHDPSRHESRFTVGQNIATTWTTKTPESWNDMRSDFPYAIGKWFDEAKYFRFGGVGGGVTGHYTQMMWATTNLVGCGYGFYYDPAKGYTKNYVCNYGPGGNVIGHTPYQKGYPNCNDFGLKESNLYAGLCSKPSSYFYGISNYITSNYKYNYNNNYNGNYRSNYH